MLKLWPEAARTGQNQDITLPNGGKNIFVITSDGVVEYKLIINRYFEETFDAFTGSMGGYTAETNWAGNNGKTDMIVIGGGERSAWYSVNFEKGGKDTDGSYLSAKTVTFADVDDAKDISDSTQPMGKGITDAEGKVLKLYNPSNGNADNKYDDYGTIRFKIGTQSRFNSVGIATADKFSFEYDIAYNAPAEKVGRTSPFGNGGFAKSGGANYTADGSVITRLVTVGDNGFVASRKHAYDNDTSGSPYSSTKDISVWRTAKMEFVKGEDGTITEYISYDGERQETSWTVSAMPTQVTLETSSSRAAVIYYDNVKLKWTLSGDYTDAAPTGLVSYTVAGKDAEIDYENKVIKADIPLYDNTADANPIDITNLTTTVKTMNAADTVTAGRTAFTGSATKTADIDYSDGGFNVYVNGDKYKLVLYRSYNLDFENGFSGEQKIKSDSKDWENVEDNPFTVPATYKNDLIGNAATANGADIRRGIYDLSSLTASTNPVAKPYGKVLGMIDNMADGGQGSQSAQMNIGKMLSASSPDSSFVGIEDATEVEIEYDTFYDKTKVTETTNVGTLDMGMMLMAYDESYAADVQGTIYSPGNDYYIYNHYTNGNKSTNSDLDRWKTTPNTSAWRHIKLAYSRPAVGGEIRGAFEVDGELGTNTNENRPTGTTREDFTIQNWPTRLRINTNAKRAMAMYFDNITVRWNVPGGNYSDVWFDGISVQDSDVAMDDSTITVTLPVYDTNGTAVGIDALNTTAAVLGDATVLIKKNAADEGTPLTGTATAIDWSAMESDATVVFTPAGGTTKTYALKVLRRFAEDFDTNSLFSGVSTLTAANAIEGEFNGKGALALGTNTKLDNGGAASGYTEYRADNNIGVKPITTETLAVNGTGAAGNALRIQKASSAKDGSSEKDTANLSLIIKNFANLDTATSFKMEWDQAYGFDFGDIDIAGRNNDIQTGFCGGVQFGGKEWYNRIHTNAGTKSAAKLQSTYKKWDATNSKLVETSVASSITANDSWHSMKFEATKIDDTSYSYVLYVDGTQVDAQTLTNVVWISYVNFLTSTRRSTNLWIDNIYITYNVN